MNIRSVGIAVALALSMGAGPAWADRGKDESGRKEEKRQEKRQKEREKEYERAEKRREKAHDRAHRDDRYFHRNGYERLSIPKGHYPPPGMCRAWYPDRPAGHQPPPHKCGAAVPQGAWLIEHPRGEQGRVRVTAFEWREYSPPPAPPRVVYRDVSPPPPTVIYREAPRVLWTPPPVLAVGEFNIANGVLVRVVVQ